MTTTIVFGDAADASVTFASASYATALAGGGTSSILNSTTLPFGQGFDTPAFPGVYSVVQAFVSFTFSAPAATERVVASYVRCYVTASYSLGIPRILDWAEYDWGASVDTGDFRPQSVIGSLTSYARVANVQNYGANVYAGTDALNTRIASGGPLRLVGASDRARAAITPTSDERNEIYSADASGTTGDPALVFTTVPNSTLQGVLGAAVQLSGGGHAYLEYDAAGTGSLLLKYHNNTSATTVGTVGVASSGSLLSNTWSGSQSVALVRDDSDNLYVIGKQAGVDGSICVETWTKGAGFTWTVGTRRTAALAGYTEGSINNLAAAWHNVGTSGTIMLVASHSAGRTPQPSTDILYALLNCQYLLTGTGSLLRASGQAQGVVVDLVSTSNIEIFNETGTLLDVVAAPSTTDRGYVISVSGKHQLGDNNTASAWRYKLASDGTSIADSDQANSQWMTKDATSKLRIIGIDGTVFVGVSTDNDTSYGITAKVQQNFGTSSSFTQLAEVKLAGGVATMPASNVLSKSQAWDVAYDANGKKLWIYYLSASSNNQLFRTGIDMNTYLASSEQVLVNGSIAASGSTNYAVRVHRGATAGQKVLVAISSRTSGGVHSTVYTVDTFNVAPNAPTLTPKTNYDASASGTFAWTFNDPNAGDTQSAYQIQINTASGTPVFDSSKQSGQVSVVGVGTSVTTVNASANLPLPANVLDGDYIVGMASIRNSGTGTVNLPAGWFDVLNFGNTRVFARRYVTGLAMPSVSYAGGSANQDTILQSFAVRGAHSASASIQSGTAATLLNSTAQDIATPGMTIPDLGTLIVRTAWKQDDATAYSTPGGYDVGPFLSTTTGDDASQGIWYRQSSASSIPPSGTVTVTGGATAISRSGIFALKPNPGNTLPTFQLPGGILTNGVDYQWRVRTWDALDAQGAWSGYGTFSVAAGGTVTITDPATDNPPGVLTGSYNVTWSVSGTTQASYRVVVTRTADGAQLINTGYLSSSTVSSYLVTGMLSDTQYQVAVTVRNVGLVESGTGTRLITPSYGSPEKPTINVQSFSDQGYILVGATNPPSGSVSLGTTPYSFESGIPAGWTTTPSASATFVQSASTAHAGTFSGMLTVSASGSQVTTRPALADSPVIVPGRRYTVSYWAYSIGGYATLGDTIDWYDASNVFLSTSTINSSISSSTWTQRSMTATAPANAAKAVYGPTLAGTPPVSTRLFIDELLLADANDRPVVTSNLVMRKKATEADSAYVAIASIPKDGSYKDFAVASGVQYTYKIRAQG